MSAAANEGTPRRRHPRADAGTVRPTARDALCLSWVVEMYGAPLDMLQRLTQATPGALSQMVYRWRKAGWVESGQLGPGPRWVWATQEGIEAFGRYPYAAHRPSAARVAHHRAVLQVRRDLELEFAAGDPQWTGERQLRFELGQAKGSEAAREHLVDGVLAYTDSAGVPSLYGVEVEISPKPIDALARNMGAGIRQFASEGAAQSDGVIWYVNDRTRALVERARARFSPTAQAKLFIREVVEL